MIDLSPSEQVTVDSLFIQITDTRCFWYDARTSNGRNHPRCGSVFSSSATTGHLIRKLNQPMLYSTHPVSYAGGRLWLGSAFKAAPGTKQNGTFTALNLETGEIAWQNRMDQPMMGGSLATAGNLAFTGEGDGNFDAFDARTGKRLWQFSAGAGCNAAPMSFELHGEQMIAVACGGNFQLGYPLGEAVFIFGLPKSR